MKTDFIEQVEHHLRAKSLQELKSLVVRMAAKMPPDCYSEILDILEDKCVIIDKNINFQIDAEAELIRIRTFLDEIEDYNIEAYYNEGYHWSDDEEDGWQIESDDGFARDFMNCYSKAERLLVQGMYIEAAEAFRLLYEAIEKFDNYNSSHDYGEISIDTFINEGLLDVDMRQIRKLRCYTALMSPLTNLKTELYYIFDISASHFTQRAIAFKDILDAGSEPVPNRDAVLTEWIEVLSKKDVKIAAPYVKESAQLLGKLDVLEQFVKTIGVAEPIAHLELCEMLTELEFAPSEIVAAAKFGLQNTPTEAQKRDSLASVLADTAREAGDEESYGYAVLERFYSAQRVENYLAVLRLNSEDANNAALGRLKEQKDKADCHIIRMLNGDYKTTFDIIKEDKKALGWSFSLKGQMFPFFIGMLSGFDEKAFAAQKLIGEVNATKGLYSILKERYRHNADEHNSCYEWCVNEVSARVDAIVGAQHRGAYFRAAWLIVAMCELCILKNETSPFALLHEFVAKYPRHSAFRGEIRSAVSEVKLQVKV